jgi:Tripartite tricarboxylate transporter TctB family
VADPHHAPLPDNGEGADTSLVSRRSLEIATAIGTLAFGGIIMKGAIEYNIGWSDRGPDPGYFPFWIGVIIALGSVVNLYRAVRDGSALGTTSAISKAQLGRIAAFVLPMIAFLVLTNFLGLYVAMALYLFGVMYLQGAYRLVSSLAVGAGSALVTYGLFEPLLKVPLLKGPLEAWLGLH